MRKIFFLTLFFLIIMVPSGHSQNSKDPNVAGQFYEANPGRLAGQIQEFFNNAKAPSLDKDIPIIIAPHAGYVFSGPVAAYSYTAVKSLAVKTVIIIAPSHYFGFDGASIWTQGEFRTPLGKVPVDSALAQQLIFQPDHFISDPRVFEQEHALEVQIPFLQKTFQDFKIVPVIMGQCSLATCEKFAQKLFDAIGQRRDVLVVISTDMSHFHKETEARDMDKKTLEAVVKMDARHVWEQCQSRKMEMCGFIPVTTAMFLANKMGLKPEVLKYATSADASGDTSRVVGYSSVIFTRDSAKEPSPSDSQDVDQAPSLTGEQKKRLLLIARQTIEEYVLWGKTKEFQETDPRLLEQEGAFVTIHKRGQLRGCIGNIIGQGPLYQTVRDMAIASATSDPRFRPVSKDELPEIDIEISVLSIPRQAHNVEDIIMGRHGVIVQRGFHRGLFLPQVADETGWSREEFLSQLCSQKAGLSPDAWKDPKTRLDIFTAQVFSEKER